MYENDHIWEASFWQSELRPPVSIESPCCFSFRLSRLKPGSQPLARFLDRAIYSLIHFCWDHIWLVYDFWVLWNVRVDLSILSRRCKSVGVKDHKGMSSFGLSLISRFANSGPGFDSRWRRCSIVCLVCLALVCLRDSYWDVNILGFGRGTIRSVRYSLVATVGSNRMVHLTLSLSIRACRCQC